MGVVSVRIPDSLKEKMKEVDLNWSDEIRKFIEQKVKEYRKKKALEEIRTRLERLPAAERGTAVKYVREDRDKH